MITNPEQKCSAEITILVENTSHNTALLCEHGLSCWIRFGGKRILFDTGQTDKIINNAEQLGVDLAETDAMILSHGHYDHTGAIPAVMNTASKATVYLHPNAVGKRYSIKNRKAKMVGTSNETENTLKTLENNNRIILTKSPTEIVDGLFATGQIPRKTTFENTGGNFFMDEQGQIPDPLYDDQAVYFNTPSGIVVILGCAHSGVINTLNHISDLTGAKKFHAVIGGLHLVNADNNRINETIRALKNFDVKKLGLAHCTGDNAVEVFMKELPETAFRCSTGTQLVF